MADIPRSTAINNNQMEQSSEALAVFPRSVSISRQTNSKRMRILRATSYSRPVNVFDKDDLFMQGFKVKLVGLLQRISNRYLL